MKTSRQQSDLIEIEEGSLGPAMLALSPLMRAFVRAKVALGCNNTRAAELAGYLGERRNSLEVAGWRLAHDPRVQAALLEEGASLMRSEGPRSIRTLVEIRDDKKAEPKDRIKSAVELLNRCGFHAAHTLRVEHHLSDMEKDARILALCAELGIAEQEARKLLVAPLEAKRLSGRLTESATAAEPMYVIHPPSSEAATPGTGPKEGSREGYDEDQACNGVQDV